MQPYGVFAEHGPCEGLRLPIESVFVTLPKILELDDLKMVVYAYDT
jgi:hypothetical protein